MVSMLNLWWACSNYAQFMLPQNDSLIVQIRPVDQKIQWYWFLSQLICTVTGDLASQLDWPRKTTPKWLFECQNPFTGSKVMDVLWLPIIITFYIDTFPKQLKYERLYYWELNKYQILDFNKKNNILILTSQMDWPQKGGYKIGYLFCCELRTPSSQLRTLSSQ